MKKATPYNRPQTWRFILLNISMVAIAYFLYAQRTDVFILPPLDYAFIAFAIIFFINVVFRYTRGILFYIPTEEETIRALQTDFNKFLALAFMLLSLSVTNILLDFHYVYWSMLALAFSALFFVAYLYWRKKTNVARTIKKIRDLDYERVRKNIAAPIAIFIALLWVGRIFIDIGNVYRFEPLGLPSSFSIEITGNYDSSGANRRYDAVMTFKENKLISGSQSYYVGEGSGCNENCNKTYKCIIKDTVWIDTDNGGACSVPFTTPTSLDDIKNNIQNGTLTPKDKCGHGNTCFELIK